MTEPRMAEPLDREALRHAKNAMQDLAAKTGDSRSGYYTQGLTNWIPTLAEHVESLAAALLAAEQRAEEAERERDESYEALEEIRAIHEGWTEPILDYPDRGDETRRIVVEVLSKETP